MALIVQKYGGTSMGDVEKIKNVARRVRNTRLNGNSIIVVVSAMGGETDRLLNLAGDITDQTDTREHDVLISTGEQVSISLLTMALNSLEVDAVSFLAHQIKIRTDSEFGRARILKIDSEKLSEEIQEGKVLVIAGFQGVDAMGNITTLGRGG